MHWRSMLPHLSVAALALGAVCFAYAGRPRWWWHLGPSRPMSMDDLLDVGPSKPLGYVSWDILRERGFEPRSLVGRFRRLGLGTRLIAPSEKRFPLGALYVYDEGALQSLLDEHHDVLRAAGWPHDAATFVHWVSDVFVHADRAPRLYRLIGRAFDDPRFAYV